jgi:hypothetical protein
VYGEVIDFKSISFAMQVYKFAHENQIHSLMAKGLFKYFKDNTKISDCCAIFNLYQFYEDKLGLQYCKKVRCFETLWS